MFFQKIVVFLNIILLSFLQTTIADINDPFRGAVVEYGAKDSNKTSKDTVLLNINSYQMIVETLKNKYSDLDIIVFPESGLLGDSKNIYAEEVPHPSRNLTPCEDNSTEVLNLLSCIAKNNFVYLVVNLAEKSSENNKTYLYNTNVVFSRTGGVIARYRKFNIYGPDGKPFYRTEKPDISFFDTDFGVRFGTFTCFDIDFGRPSLDLVYEYNITHFVYPSAWFSELPFLTAVQAQSGWTYSTNTVLLASGYNNPESGSTGTGIYFGRSWYKESLDELSLQNQIKGDFAIVSYIPKSPNALNFSLKSEINYFYNTSAPIKAPLKLIKDQLEVYTTKLIKDSTEYISYDNLPNFMIQSITDVKETVCDRGLCCEFSFKMRKLYRIDVLVEEPDFNGDAFGHYKYRLAVFNGVRSYGGGIATGGVQVCSIISCLNDNEKSCGERTDSSSPNSIKGIYGIKYNQFFTSFYNVTIKANLTSSNNTFLMTSILSGSNDYLPEIPKDNLRFGKIADSNFFDISKMYDANKKELYVFESRGNITNPASINLYNRLFDLDGKNVTQNHNNNPPVDPASSGKSSILRTSINLLINLLMVSFLIC